MHIMKLCALICKQIVKLSSLSKREFCYTIDIGKEVKHGVIARRI